jgi:hypothetical protein
MKAGVYGLDRGFDFTVGHELDDDARNATPRRFQILSLSSFASAPQKVGQLNGLGRVSWLPGHRSGLWLAVYFCGRGCEHAFAFVELGLQGCCSCGSAFMASLSLRMLTIESDSVDLVDDAIEDGVGEARCASAGRT